MKFQRWTATKLQNLHAQICADNSMIPDYQASEDPYIASIEQYDESDFVFLSRVAQTVGMSLKIKNNTITIFSRKEYESRAPKGFITFPPSKSSLFSLSQITQGLGLGSSYGVNGTGGMISWNVADNLDGIFKDCRVVIRSVYSGLTTEGKYVDPNNPPVGASVNVRKNIYLPSYPAVQAATGTYYDGNAQNIQQANFIAYNELRKRAEKRHSLQLTVPMALMIEAGDVWTMQQIGPDFDGNWIAIEVEQTISESGSQTRCSFEKCLGW